VTSRLRHAWALVRPRLRQLGLLLGGLLLLYQVVQAIQAIRPSQVATDQPGRLAVAFLLALGTNGLLTGGWLAIIRQLGVSLTGAQALTGYSLSFLPRYIPGSIWGYLSRNEWLLQQHQVSYGVANWSSALEVLFILLSGGVVSMAYWAATHANDGLWWAAAGLVLLVLVGGVLSQRQLHSPRLGGYLARFGLAVSGIRRLPFAGLVAFYTILWLCHGAAIFAIAQSFFELSTNQLFSFVFAYYVAWSAGFLVLFVPSGLGIRETTLSGLLVAVAGLSPEQAVVVSVMSRVISLLAELTWVVGTLGIQRVLRNQPESR
jgi:uncharacterized membrane protein YbhN (UPF0104 family)